MWNLLEIKFQQDKLFTDMKGNKFINIKLKKKIASVTFDKMKILFFTCTQLCKPLKPFETLLCNQVFVIVQCNHCDLKLPFFETYTFWINSRLALFPTETKISFLSVFLVDI